MEHLPDEVLLEIFNYVDGKNLKNVMLVCARWHKIITSSASTMRLLPLNYTDIVKSDGNFHHNFYSLLIQHVIGINLSNHIFEQGLGDFIQRLEVSYCSLSAFDLKSISNAFVNLKFLTLIKVKLLNETNNSECINHQKDLKLSKLILLKVDHIILDYLNNLKTLELEITDSNENQVNKTSLINFVLNQNYLISLSLGEMSNNTSVFFHENVTASCKFRLKKFHSIFCSTHSSIPKFEENYISFLNHHSHVLEKIKFSGNSLPLNIYKFSVNSIINLKSLEIEANAVPQEKSFYEHLKRNFNLKSLGIYSTITRNNFNGIKELLAHYPNINRLNLMDTDEFVSNDLFHCIAWYLINLKELTVLNFNKSFTPHSQIKTLEKFSIKIINNIEQLLKFVIIHGSTLKNLSIWWIIRDFESKIIEDIVSLPHLMHLKIGGRFIVNKRIYNSIVKKDHKNLKTLHLIVNNYDEVKHLKFSFPCDKNLYKDLKCSYFEEHSDREPLND